MLLRLQVADMLAEEIEGVAAEVTVIRLPLMLMRRVLEILAEEVEGVAAEEAVRQMLVHHIAMPVTILINCINLNRLKHLN